MSVIDEASSSLLFLEAERLYEGLKAYIKPLRYFHNETTAIIIIVGWKSSLFNLVYAITQFAPSFHKL